MWKLVKRVVRFVWRRRDAVEDLISPPAPPPPAPKPPLSVRR